MVIVYNFPILFMNILIILYNNSYCFEYDKNNSKTFMRTVHESGSKILVELIIIKASLIPHDASDTHSTSEVAISTTFNFLWEQSNNNLDEILKINYITGIKIHIELSRVGSLYLGVKNKYNYLIQNIDRALVVDFSFLYNIYEHNVSLYQCRDNVTFKNSNSKRRKLFVTDKFKPLNIYNCSIVSGDFLYTFNSISMYNGEIGSSKKNIIKNEIEGDTFFKHLKPNSWIKIPKQDQILDLNDWLKNKGIKKIAQKYKRAFKKNMINYFLKSNKFDESIEVQRLQEKEEVTTVASESEKNGIWERFSILSVMNRGLLYTIVFCGIFLTIVIFMLLFV